jgi:D-alanyl-D-alanine carboxypeptidase (penicillin-binding protein 5/6)
MLQNKIFHHFTVSTAISCGITLVVVTLLSCNFFFMEKNCIYPEQPLPLTESQQTVLVHTLNDNFPQRKALLSALPYPTVPVQLEVNAESAILIDTATGSILYEKNADEEIPPASMTKLVEMYVVFNAIKKGEVKLDDVVPLPPQCWATHMPHDASLMFLAEGQQVTLRELLLGLAIASGNDASVAVAYYICGGMDAFVQRMNDAVQSLGLTHTHFVESSGYSEKNITTAREFASFARVYIQSFPEALTDFHSQEVLRYPLRHNLPEFQQGEGDTQAITQYNTNKLLGVLPGCDGLKTGFINESGYNLALTAKRFGTRFLSVTMKGPGKGAAQGNKYRIEDGTTLMEFAFKSFADYHAPTGEKAHVFAIAVPGAKESTVNLIPAEDETLTVPFIISDSPGGAASSVHVTAQFPSHLYKTTVCGKQYGTLTYKIGDTVLRTIPLVADRTDKPAFLLKRIEGAVVSLMIKAMGK